MMRVITRTDGSLTRIMGAAWRHGEAIATSHVKRFPSRWPIPAARPAISCACDTRHARHASRERRHSQRSRIEGEGARSTTMTATRRRHRHSRRSPSRDQTPPPAAHPVSSNVPAACCTAPKDHGDCGDDQLSYLCSHTRRQATTGRRPERASVIMCRTGGYPGADYTALALFRPCDPLECVARHHNLDDFESTRRLSPALLPSFGVW